MTIRELMIKKKSYIVEIKIDPTYHLFIEALNELGCAFHTEFNAVKILPSMFNVELVTDGEGEQLTLSEWWNLDRDEKEYIKLGQKARYLFKKGLL